MGDIYDDIDEILGADDEVETTDSSLENDKNFNESELEDIMSEIESLEKEFDSEADTLVSRNPLQDEVERELAESMALASVTSESVETESFETESFETESFETESFETESVVVESPKAHVLSFDKPKAVAPAVTSIAPTPASGVSFAAQGSMALTLDFKIGEECAKLTIDPVTGLTITLSGVELTINEADGCHVIMDNGMKFTIPLSSLEKNHKKKAA